MIAFFPILENFCPLFLVICPDGSHFAQNWSHFAQNTTPQPLFFSPLSCKPFRDMHVHKIPPPPLPTHFMSTW